MKYEMPTVDDRLIWDTWFAMYWIPSVTAALETGIFETLAEKSMTLSELVQRSKLNERGVTALLRMLTSLGFLALHGNEYTLTSVSRNYLLKDSPFYWGGVLERIGVNNPQHEQLIELLKQGSSHSSAVGGESSKPSDAWESGQLDIEQARHVAAFMHSHSMPAAMGVSRRGDFSGVKKLLDVGGGSGCFSIAIAQQFPDIKCTIMDLDAMCRLVPDYVNAGGGSDQVDAIAVDMFREAWPDGYDAMFFSNILHDWNFDTCASLLAKAYDRLPQGGRIYIHETLLDDDGNGPVPAVAFSVVMLIGTQGQQFTFPELAQLLTNAGFKDIDVQPTYSYYSLITAYK